MFYLTSLLVAPFFFDDKTRFVMKYEKYSNYN